MERTPERVQELNKLITGIAITSQHKFYGISLDDIIQDLWLNLIQREEEENWEFPIELAARVCYNRIASLQRYLSYRNTYSYDQLIETQESSEDQSEESLSHSCYASGDHFDDILMIDDLLHKFEEGTRESFYIKFWMTASNVRDCGVQPPNGREKNGYTEDNLAKMLGYSGVSSSGYKGFRWKMKQMIADYFGKSL